MARHSNVLGLSYLVLVATSALILPAFAIPPPPNARQARVSPVFQHSGYADAVYPSGFDERKQSDKPYKKLVKEADNDIQTNSIPVRTFLKRMAGINGDAPTDAREKRAVFFLCACAIESVSGTQCLRCGKLIVEILTNAHVFGANRRVASRGAPCWAPSCRCFSPPPSTLDPPSLTALTLKM